MGPVWGKEGADQTAGEEARGAEGEAVTRLCCNAARANHGKPWAATRSRGRRFASKSCGARFAGGGGRAKRCAVRMMAMMSEALL